MVAAAHAGILASAPLAYTHGAPLAYAAAPGSLNVLIAETTNHYVAVVPNVYLYYGVDLQL